MTAYVLSPATRRICTVAIAVSVTLLPLLAFAQDVTPAPVPAEPLPVPTPAPPVAQLPSNLSPWGMFLGADLVVKAVMIGLAFASVVTWTVWMAKSIELTLAKRRAAAGLRKVTSAPSLPEAQLRLGRDHTPVAALLRAAAEEIRLSSDLPAAGTKDRIAGRLERIEAAGGRAMARGTGLLATIGSTAPFVGLFGTVWGIMNSFVGISKAQTTSLAVVAPGIAEALLATAIGLVAAIPAVVIYNVFARAIGGYRAMLADGSAEVLRIAGRDLDRHHPRLAEAAE